MTCTLLVIKVLSVSIQKEIKNGTPTDVYVPLFGGTDAAEC